MTRHRAQDERGPSQRQLRVAERVRHVLAEMLVRGEVHDPVIEGHVITIPEVRMAADLRLATIYVMPLAGRDADEVLAAPIPAWRNRSADQSEIRAGHQVRC
jgi:ribosome-binding factor A